MSLPRLADAEGKVTAVVHAPVRHLCPFKNEADDGTVTIAWVCNGSTIELHSLAGYLTAFASEVISHEDLVEHIAAGLGALGGGITVTSVTAQFTTAGMTVEVSRAVPVHTIGT